MGFRHMAFSFLEDEVSSAFSGLDEDLYDAALMDEFTLKNLVDHLASLNERVRSTHAFTKGLLKPRTIYLIRSVSSRARIIAKNMMDVHRTTDEVTTKRGNEIAKVLARMSLRDSNASTSSPDTLDTANMNEISAPVAAENIDHPNQSNSSSASCVSGVQRSLLTLKTFEWLLANLHNPYPSSYQKSLLATHTGSSLKSVNNSFDTARRRIGWTKFTKKYFGGKNALAIDCAHRIFVSPDPKYPIPDRIRKDLLGVRTEVEKVLQNQPTAVKAHAMVESVLKRVDISHASRPSSVGTKRINKRCCSSEVDSISQPARHSEARPSSPEKTSNTKESAIPDCLHKQYNSASPGCLQIQRKRKRDLQLSTEENEHDKVSYSRSYKRARSLSRTSSESSNASTLGPSTPNTGSPVSTFIAITGLSWLSTSQASRKRSHCDAGNDYTRGSKRRCNAYLTDSLSSKVTAKYASDCDIPIGFPGANENVQSTEISFDNICNSSSGPESSKSISWNNSLFPSIASDSDTEFVGMLVACSSNWDTIVGEGAPDLLSSYAIRTDPNEPSRDRISDESSSVTSDSNKSAANSGGTPLGLFHSDVFGEDFADFPTMPDFNIDWTSIPPPSLDSLLLHPDFSFPSSVLMPMNCVPNDEAGLGSDSTLVGPSAPSLDNASSQLSYFG